MRTPQYKSTQIDQPTERFQIEPGTLVQHVQFTAGQWVPATSKLRSIPPCRPLMVGEFLVMTGMKNDYFPIVRLSAFGLNNATFMVLDSNGQSRMLQAHA